MQFLLQLHVEPPGSGLTRRLRKQSVDDFDRETQLALTLPSMVWKQLVAQPMDDSDLGSVVTPLTDWALPPPSVLKFELGRDGEAD